jgi:hygromycin-B 4-O-kinase
VITAKASLYGQSVSDALIMRKPSFSSAAVQAKLKGCMANISELTLISEGEESQAYRFQSGTQTYVIRLNRAIEGFEKDAFACRKFARPNLPIPEIIRIGQIDDHFYCISENMPGVTLQDLHPQAVPPVLGPTAEILDAIAESNLDNMTGFGSFNARGVGSYESWRDFLTSIANPDQYDWAAVHSLVDMDIVNRFLDRLNGLAAHCPETRQLIHGDFGSNNVLTDGHRITGVIDWSEASIGDPLYDVANIFFWSTWLDCMQQQARYFETHLAGFPNLGGRLLCYQLRIGLAEIYQNAIEGNMRGLAWATSRCRDLIR